MRETKRIWIEVKGVQVLVVMARTSEDWYLDRYETPEILTDDEVFAGIMVSVYGISNEYYDAESAA